MQRRVEPEILDHLPAEDLSAIRSRRDLRAINFLMGNERWIVRSVRRFSAEAKQGGITEFGAGEGRLAERLQHEMPGARIECCDLAPRPAGLHPGIEWRRADVLETPPQHHGVLIASLFLHHFEGAALETLGKWCGQFRAFCFAEPLRSRGAIAQGTALLPLVNSVTRHDMIVSIRAGFVRGELPALLGLDPRQWRVEEQCTWRGGLRVL
ncbi:MAG: hypothetical protein JWO82_2571, partial [Akkermansiaceae bacterium]|nr:hypothetical protein [Akkermansiaceae bacterium]